MKPHNPRGNNPIPEKLPEVLILDKSYTRTYSQDDSFIANIRRELPETLSIPIFESAIQLALTAPEYSFIRNYYEKRHTPEGDVYALQTNNSQESPPGNVEKAMISEVLEKVDEVPKRNVFFASMHISPEHSYFCPPNLKHISGMHLIETARQFAIACHHLFGNVPLQDITFMLEAVSGEFYQYARIDRAVELRASLHELKQNKKKVWRMTGFEVTACQKNDTICKITTKSTILPLRLYRQLKAEKDSHDSSLETGAQSDEMVAGRTCEGKAIDHG